MKTKLFFGMLIATAMHKVKQNGRASNVYT